MTLSIDRKGLYPILGETTILPDDNTRYLYLILSEKETTILPEGNRKYLYLMSLGGKKATIPSEDNRGCLYT